jgi:hypothetical protein
MQERLGKEFPVNPVSKDAPPLRIVKTITKGVNSTVSMAVHIEDHGVCAVKFIKHGKVVMFLARVLPSRVSPSKDKAITYLI